MAPMLDKRSSIMDKNLTFWLLVSLINMRCNLWRIVFRCLRVSDWLLLLPPAKFEDEEDGGLLPWSALSEVAPEAFASLTETLVVASVEEPAEVFVLLARLREEEEAVLELSAVGALRLDPALSEDPADELFRVVRLVLGVSSVISVSGSKISFLPAREDLLDVKLEPTDPPFLAAAVAVVLVLAAFDFFECFLLLVSSSESTSSISTSSFAAAAASVSSLISVSISSSVGGEIATWYASIKRLAFLLFLRLSRASSGVNNWISLRVAQV